MGPSLRPPLKILEGLASFLCTLQKRFPQAYVALFPTAGCPLYPPRPPLSWPFWLRSPSPSPWPVQVQSVVLPRVIFHRSSTDQPFCLLLSPRNIKPSPCAHHPRKTINFRRLLEISNVAPSQPLATPQIQPLLSQRAKYFGRVLSIALRASTIFSSKPVSCLCLISGYSYQSVVTCLYLSVESRTVTTSAWPEQATARTSTLALQRLDSVDVSWHRKTATTPLAPLNQDIFRA